MIKPKLQGELTVMEAVDYLSSMAEIDLHESGGDRWLDRDLAEQNREVIKETFRVLHHYLRHLYEKNRDQLKDLDTQKGIQAIMVLAGEAAQKLDTFTSLFKGKEGTGSVTKLPDYQQLQKFYLTAIVQKFRETVPIEEDWQAEWNPDEAEALDKEKQGLKDLETVRSDREYELFFIKKEDSRPYFDSNLLRHIRLLGDFDESLIDPTGEDPFLRVKIIQDRDVHSSAKEILKLARPYIDEFYKEAMHYKGMHFVSVLNKVLMALMLCANGRNLMQNTNGKSCILYYADFHSYLRAALASSEYKKFVSSSNGQAGKFAHVLINLSHALCCFFFTRISMHKEAVELIHRLIARGAGSAPALSKTHSIWDHLLEDDERIRRLLKHYPNGPLLKALDALNEGDQLKGFDPINQGNLPHQLFNFSYEDQHVTCLRLPCPTFQEYIQKSQAIDEFRGLLRYMGSELNAQKHLLINLQDRTSWQEHMRCSSMEKLQKEAEFVKTLYVVTLPKNTEFYLQSTSYENLHQSDLFIQQFQEQIASGEVCGFYFPPTLKMQELKSFTARAMSLIHRHFFSGKNTLTRKNRLDFIEIFYHFLILELIDLLKPDSISFTCKDAIDQGVAASAGFYAFLKILSGLRTWSKEDRDFLLWMLYTPALTIRERAIDLQKLHRLIQAMATFQAEVEAQHKAISDAANKLFSRPLFAKMKIQEAI